MNTIENLRDIVYNQGLNVLLQRMEAVVEPHILTKLCNPIIVSADIVDLNAVEAKIKKTWTCFNIEDIEINLKNQVVTFRIYGSCWVPSRYQSYIVFEHNWSQEETEIYNYYKTIKEEYAEKNSLPLAAFESNGIELKML